MDKKKKLRDLYDQLNALQGKANLPTKDISSVSDSLIEEEVAQLRTKLTDNPSIKILKRFGEELKQFRTDFDLQPVIASIQGLQGEMERGNQNTLNEFENRLRAVKGLVDIKGLDIASLTKEISQIKTEFADQVKSDTTKNYEDSQALKKELRAIKEEIQTANTRFADLTKEFETTAKGNSEDKASDKTQQEAQRKELEDKLKGELDSLRRDVTTRLGNLGGGGLSRQIFIGGVDALTKYTDINLKAGSNVTITYSNNNATKKVDITITSSGGGGGAGITRSINSIAVDTAAGNSTTTDYVYLVTGTTALTLPDAALNTNLYTVKNVGSGVVTVNTTSAQTIDGSPTVVMPLQYTSVDIESDGANWVIT